MWAELNLVAVVAGDTQLSIPYQKRSISEATVALKGLRLSSSLLSSHQFDDDPRTFTTH